MGVACVAGSARPAVAQITLADDIILAIKGEEANEKARQSILGRAPGSPSSLFSTGSHARQEIFEEDIGAIHREFLPRLSRRLPRVGASTPRMELPPALPEPESPLPVADDPTAEEFGPPGGLTLGQAIQRLIAANDELRTKFHEIALAEADVLTAGLRENPLLFYDSDKIPYGNYTSEHPGDVTHGISVVLPVDYNGKRRTRQATAEARRRVRQAQYQNAVRLEIAELGGAYVDVLDARDEVRRVRLRLAAIDGILQGAPRGLDPDQIEGLTLDRETVLMHLGDGEQRLARAKQVLGELLALPPETAAGLELAGTLRDTAPPAPPVETLIDLALRHRPDLAAHRLGIPHAEAEVRQARAERLPNAYFVLSPLDYTQRWVNHEGDSRGWGIGIFLPLAVFDRNQGNIRRSRVNLDRTHAELATLQRRIVTEVITAEQQYRAGRRDLERLEQQVLPALRQRRERARRRYEAGAIDLSDYLAALEDRAAIPRYYQELRVRHRRSMLELNTSIGCRLLP